MTWSPTCCAPRPGGTLRRVELGGSYLWQSLRDFPVVVAAPLLLLSTEPRAREAARFALAVTIAWALMLLYSGGYTFSSSRMVFPLVPTLTVVASQAVLAVLARLSGRQRVAFATGAVCWIAGVGVTEYGHVLAPSHGFDNVRRWTAVGKYLKTHADGQRLAMVPVGATAYFSELPVLDLVGLTSREVAAAGRTVPPDLLEPKWIGHERHNLEWTLDWKPDLVVTTRFRPTRCGVPPIAWTV